MLILILFVVPYSKKVWKNSFNYTIYLLHNYLLAIRNLYYLEHQYCIYRTLLLSQYAYDNTMHISMT